MGSGSSKGDKKSQLAKSRRIDKDFEKERENVRGTIKLLLLGK